MNLLPEKLGKGVLLISGGFADISLRGSIDDVTNSETLNSLVFPDTSTAVVASHGLDVTTAVLGSTVISAFDGHSIRNLEIYGKERTNECRIVM